MEFDWLTCEKIWADNEINSLPRLQRIAAFDLGRLVSAQARLEVLTLAADNWQRIAHMGKPCELGCNNRELFRWCWERLMDYVKWQNLAIWFVIHRGWIHGIELISLTVDRLAESSLIYFFNRPPILILHSPRVVYPVFEEHSIVPGSFGFK